MAIYTTYESIGNRETLMDIIEDISSTETPLYSGLRKVNIDGKYPEWLTDSLATATANAAVEGAAFSYGTLTPATRVGNRTQILVKPFQVSETEDVVSKAGRDSEYAYQLQKATKEIIRDAEYALINSTVSAGTSAAARTMDGVLAWITTNVETGSGTGTEALTEDMFNDALQTIYTAGGRPDTAYVNGFQKRQISSFTASNTKNIDAGAKKLVNSIDVYVSDFGMIQVVYDVFMSTSVVALLEKSKWEIGILRGFAKKDVSVDGDSRKAAVVGEITLIARNQASSGKITQLSVS